MRAALKGIEPQSNRGWKMGLETADGLSGLGVERCCAIRCHSTAVSEITLLDVGLIFRCVSLPRSLDSSLSRTTLTITPTLNREIPRTLSRVSSFAPEDVTWFLLNLI